jgi:hypothetical protein
VICDLHLHDRDNAREAVGHEADQRPVAQTHKIGFFYDYAVLIGRFSNRNVVERSRRPSSVVRTGVLLFLTT